MSPPKPTTNLESAPLNPSSTSSTASMVSIPADVSEGLNTLASTLQNRRLSSWTWDSISQARVVAANPIQSYYPFNPSRRQLRLLATAARENLKLILILLALGLAFVCAAKFVEDELIPVLDNKDRIYILESNPPGHEKVITLPRLE